MAETNNVNDTSDNKTVDNKTVDNKTVDNKSNDSKIKKVKKSKKQRCNVKGCKGRIVLMIGNCKWCNLDYCQEHRIPECHNCSGLDDCKKNSFERNEILNNVSCQFKKIDHIESF